MGLLASGSPVLFLSVLQRLEEKLWQAQRRYHRTLIAASSGMTRIKDLKQLCRLIVYVVNRTVGLVSTSLYLLDGKLEQYTLAAARSNRGAFTESPTPRTHPLVDVLRQEHDLLVLQELRDLLSSSKAGDASVTPLSEAVAWMHERGVELIVPSFTEGTLLAFLALGPKRNHEPYTMDDVAMFSGLANQAALGIENAMFFEERKTSEAYMIQSEKLASLGQLASGMAHEIHNPLTIISGEAQLYLERHKGEDAEVDKVLRSIIEECHRAADITRRILRFAKPSPSEFQPVDLRATVEEAFQLIAYQVRLDRVERTVEAPSDLPKISGNQNQLQEVFLNLIVNACQAMGETGGALHVKLAHANGCVEAKVTDTGPGISPSRLTKIFDPFFTTKSTGTGLGLFVAQRIVHAHNGSIDVESTEGTGTTFTIRLPVLKDAPAS
jgi:signal transduction histidine kinase